MAGIAGIGPHHSGFLDWRVNAFATVGLYHASMWGLDAEAPPLRIFFGSGGLTMTRAEYARRIETWRRGTT